MERIIKRFSEWSINEEDFNLETPATDSAATAAAITDEPKEDKKDITKINFELLYSYDYFVDGKNLVVVTDCPVGSINSIYDSFLSMVNGSSYKDNFDDFLRDKGFAAIIATKAGMIKTK